MKDEDAREPESASGLTRRDFMKISGIGVAVPLLVSPTVVVAAGEEVEVHGPGKVPVQLTVNGMHFLAIL